ncbi:MAG: hypothetical protein V4637_06330 [Pseudomonadota bacterium]
MNRWLRRCVVLAMASWFTLATAVAEDSHPAPSTLRHDPRYILEAVARAMHVRLRPDIPLPAIFLQSVTPLQRFQSALAKQWGFEPPVFSNAYAVAQNEIYLMDDASYYTRLRRTLDDSLAHEFAHYIQVHYFNADLTHESCELEAISVQQWFRYAHATPATSPLQMSEARTE